MLLTNPVLMEEPRQIPSLKAWWDFSDSATRTIIADFISELTDKSPTGADLYYGNNGPYHAQPANQINGRPSAGFTGSSVQTMHTVDDKIELRFGTGQFSIVVVFTNIDVNRSALVHRGDATAFYSFRIHDTDDDNGKATPVTKGISAVVGKIACDDYDYGDGSAFILTMLRDVSDYLRLYNNNVESTNSPDTTANGDLDPASGSPLVWIGSDRMQAGTAGQWFAGQIGDVFMFDDDLSSDEREYLHRYLRKKWSI